MKLFCLFIQNVKIKVFQVQMPPPQGIQNVQTQIHYTPQLQYQQNEHMNMQAQVHYAVQPSQHSFELHKSESSEQQKGHGVKRRFNDPEGPQVIKKLKFQKYFLFNMEK